VRRLAVYGPNELVRRQAVGSADYFAILQRWAASRADDNVRTGEFVRLAEKISGEELNPLFR